MGTSVKEGSSEPDLWKKGASFRIYGEQVDGSDVIAVRDLTRRLRARAEREHEPAIMDVVSFRFRGHSVIDPDRYRNVEEVKRGRVEHDPITPFARRLLDDRIVDDAFIRDTADQVEHEVQEAIDFADHSRAPAMEDLYNYTYASPVPNTISDAEQEMFQTRLRSDARGEGKR